jgi:hypothetical protein
LEQAANRDLEEFEKSLDRFAQSSDKIPALPEFDLDREFGP